MKMLGGAPSLLKWDQPGGWVRIADAAAQLVPRFGSYSRAQMALAQALRLGTVPCRARRSGVETEAHRVKIHGKRIDTSFRSEFDEISYRVQIPGSVWDTASDWERDLRRWDWPSGRLCVTHDDPLPAQRMHFFDVVVRQVDINELKEDSHQFYRVKESIGKTAAKPSSNASRLKKYDWDSVLARLAAEMAFTSLDVLKTENVNERGAQANLERWFANAFLEQDIDPPSENELRIRARMVMGAVRDRKGR